jgi:isoleucyl-tRNA synthetase
MSSYREYKGLDLPSKEKDILKFWKENDIFQRSIDERPEDNTFVFYEGPPSANGKPGIHHVMSRTIKDLFCRYHTMKGERVERKGGWDTHGLPVEIKVESELGITKEDIGVRISVEEYNEECRKAVMRYKEMWDDLTRKMGYWADLDKPYITYENEYIESVWNLLKILHDRDMLYKGYTIQPYSPAAGTGLSSHELNMPGAYKELKDVSITAQFKVIRNDKSSVLYRGHDNDVFFLAWTTTPWTLPSNCAVAVGPKIRYAVVSTFNPYTHKPVSVVLAEELVSKFFNAKAADLKLEDYKPGAKLIPFQVVNSISGKELEGIHYEQLMPYVQPEEGDAFRAILGDFVSTEEGTGIVHTASVFGADDYRVCQLNNVPSILVRRGKEMAPLVDKQGRFVTEVTDFANMFVREEFYSNEERAGDSFESTDLQIAIKLKKENKAFKVEKYVHNYPHCWRTDKPVLYYPLESWFIRASACRDRMVELNKTINWKPAHTGEKRFGNWLENLQDWNLSRSRYWGTPLPIWRTANGSHEICIGSVQQLREEVAKANSVLGLNQEVPEDLHKPFIDDVVLVSSEGLEMRRELDLIDVWFDSGAMPYAQWHYPMQNQDVFKRNFPADFICEGVDQTRGWFYSLHAIASMVMDGVAFRNVVSNGLVLDKNGVKMSKRLGNVVDPFETLDKYGADTTRWYLMTNAQPWDNLKFDLAGVEEVRRKFFGTLYNTYSFFSLYANIDGFVYSENRIPIEARPVIDRWIISLANTLIKEVDEDYADYEPTNAGRKVQEFVEDHLSNWYVRLCRRRFWKGEYTSDKIAAYQTLYECLEIVAKLMAPISPFFAEWLYKNLNDATSRESHVSVHLALFPASDDECIDQKLEERMDYAQRISSLVLSLRKKEKIRVRQPLQKILIPVLNDSFIAQVNAVQDLIKAEVNVKDIEYITDTSGFIKKKVKPNYKTLGRRLGKNMKAAAQIIQELGQDDIAAIERDQTFQLELENEPILLDIADFEISAEEIPGWQVATDQDITVALDITLTDPLKKEGIARELVNRIQNIRKQSDFDVTDRIIVEISPDERIEDSLKDFRDFVAAEVLADDIQFSENISGDTYQLVDELEVSLHVRRS